MDVAEKDAVCPRRLLAVVEGQGNDVLEESWVFKGLERRIEVTLVRKVDALQYGPLRVQQVSFIALTGEAILRQATMGARACAATAAQVEAQLLAASITPGTGVGTF